MKMVPTDTQLSWGSYSEEIPSPNYNGTFAKDGLVEQISITRDKTLLTNKDTPTSGEQMPPWLTYITKETELNICASLTKKRKKQLPPL